MERELRRRGLVVRAARAFPIVHTSATVDRQLRWAEREANRVSWSAFCLMSSVVLLCGVLVLPQLYHAHVEDVSLSWCVGVRHTFMYDKNCMMYRDC